MKKTLITISCLLLSACIAHETDFDTQAAQRQANLDARRQATGCTFVRDHEAYRNCILNTHYMQTPHTYVPSEMQDGQPLVIAGEGYKMSGSVQQTAWAAPTTTAHMQSVETVCEKTYQPQEAVITTTETPIAPPPPEVIVVEQEQPLPVQQDVVVPQPATWWDDYQETKQPVAAPKCPCEDPNDPCPQCYEK